MTSTRTAIQIPKPSCVPSGATKTTAQDFSGHGAPCVGCGTVTERCGHGIDPANHTHLCCQGMMIVTATWAPKGFTSQMLLSADGTEASCEWAVCPACRVPVE